MSEFMDEWGGKENFFGIKGLRGFHMVCLLCILILINTHLGLLFGLLSCLIDLTQRRVAKSDRCK